MPVEIRNGLIRRRFDWLAVGAVWTLKALGQSLFGAKLDYQYNWIAVALWLVIMLGIAAMAYLAAREAVPAAHLCTLAMLSHTSADGIDRFPTGGNEPILTLTGERIVDAKGRLHVLHGKPGASLMSIAVASGVAGIDAICGGLCSCGTCHVHVEIGRAHV